MTRYRVSHRTAYHYDPAMADGYTLAYLYPRSTAHQTVERAAVTVTPEPDERSEYLDAFGNCALQLGVHHQHDGLVLDAASEVVVAPVALDGAGPPWEEVVAEVRGARGPEALTLRPLAGSSRYVDLERRGAALRPFAAEAFPAGLPVVEGARTLCHLIYSTFDYDPSFTEISTPLSVVLEGRRGVCQDFAHLAIGVLRSLGLAARYVSGYLETRPPDAEVVGSDASHAWCSVWVPGQGWLDFDPTNDHLPANRHITVAWGRDYGDVAPSRGVVIGPAARQTLSVDVHVKRV
jgi:transglutaminase-like putative cysteine protease